MDIQGTELGSLPSVRSAATVMREIVFNNRNFLSASLICAGWDPYEGYQIYSVNQTGFINEGDYQAGGSGSTYIKGYMDANYDKKMSKAACTEFLKNCVSLACLTDGSSGGCIRMVDISEEKVTRTFHDYTEMTFK
jgi:20S proteasome subunit beta 1